MQTSNPRETLNEPDVRVSDFLSNPESYKALETRFAFEQTAHTVDIISTHCAHLFLSDGLVVKIKRPVKYTYLDMTRLDDRERFCRRELELNRPLLPSIYLDVLAVVVEPDGSIQFTQSVEGHQHVLEWCLLMKRFEESAVLDNLATAGLLNNDLAQKIGTSVALYHQSLKPLDVSDGDTRIEEVVNELISEMQALADLIPPARVSEFARSGSLALQAGRECLVSRSKAGFVRRCHGDLHLRNLVLIDNKPVPFDALEFDERLASTDTLYDLSFVLMDLAHRGLLQQENRVLNEYLLHASAQDMLGLQVLPLFLFCRAGIKAMTIAQAARLQTGDAGSGKQESLQYLEQAIAYLAPRKPRLVAIGGFSGSGKSTVSSRLPTQIAQSPGAVLIRSDPERKVYFQVAPDEELPDEHYNARNSDIVYERVFCQG